MIVESNEISNTTAGKTLRQVTLDKEVDDRLIKLQERYNTTLKINLTVQDVIRKLIFDHPDYQGIN